MPYKKINIFTGHFGSGKTEVSVNFALNMKNSGYKTAIVDLDIVNPYFRTADVKDELEKQGIHVIVPPFANTNVDVPALPAEINSLFEDNSVWSVFDVGGDDIGAKALGRYRQEIINEGYDMYVVVNTNRPFTDTKEKISSLIYELENASRLKVTKLVNNTNLLQDTTAEDLEKGYKILNKVSEFTGLPIGFTAFVSEAIEGTEYINESFGKILLLDKKIKLPWE